MEWGPGDIALTAISYIILLLRALRAIYISFCTKFFHVQVLTNKCFDITHETHNEIIQT